MKHCKYKEMIQFAEYRFLYGLRDFKTMKNPAILELQEQDSNIPISVLESLQLCIW